MTTVWIAGADEILRPPEDGLPYLRHDRAEQMNQRVEHVQPRPGEAAAR